jgi:hypothetical protein
MSDGPEWFAPKRSGFGTGWPIAWQGWALTLAFVAIMVPVTFTFIVILARTTKGGWRWRSGEEE